MAGLFLLVHGGVGAGVRQRHPRRGLPATNTGSPCRASEILASEIHASYAL